jgi:hypothetical protein
MKVTLLEFWALVGDYYNNYHHVYINPEHISDIVNFGDLQLKLSMNNGHVYTIPLTLALGYKKFQEANVNNWHFLINDEGG